MQIYDIHSIKTLKSRLKNVSAKITIHARTIRMIDLHRKIQPTEPATK